MQRNTLLILLICILLALPTLACGSGSGVSASSGSPGSYTVQPGDTLAGIAERYGTTVQGLVDANKDTYPSLATNPGLINVGWVLVIPGGQGSVAAQSGESSASAPSAAATAFDVAAVEQDIFRLVNEERVKAGLQPLEWDPVLGEMARARSQDMVNRGYYGHDDPVTGEILIYKLLEEKGYSGSENIARDAVVPGFVFVAQWMHSTEGHRESLLSSEWHATGVGLALTPSQRLNQSYAIATQVFRR